MTTFTALVYYVALYKHEAPQSLHAGPFTDFGKACGERDALNKSSRNCFVVVSSRVECEYNAFEEA